jgi:hypothetical protein
MHRMTMNFQVGMQNRRQIMKRPMLKCTNAKGSHVATLALGSRPRQRGCKGAGQREARESHQGLPGV